MAFRRVYEFFVRKEWVATVAALTLVATELADALADQGDGVSPEQIVLTVVSVLVARFGVYSKASYEAR